MNRQDIEIAIDLTRELMLQRTDIEMEYVIDGAEDLLQRHYLLIMTLENNDDILSHSFSSKPLRIASKPE